VVALEAAARGKTAPRTQARRAASRWVLGTATVLVAGAVGPLAVAPGIGHLSAAVLSLLLGSGAAAVALALGSARAAFLVTVALLTLLDLGRLPPHSGPGYEEPEALWQTDQSLDVSLAVAGASPTRLAVLAQPVFAGDQAPFGISATLNGRRLAWQCPLQHSLQWLELPLPDRLVTGSTLDVRLGLSGAPNRDQAYLVVYRSASRDGFLIGLAEDPSVPAPTTTCAAV
jgi:hypothetical protein